jgi:hypothetical protein
MDSIRVTVAVDRLKIDSVMSQVKSQIALSKINGQLSALNNGAMVYSGSRHTVDPAQIVSMLRQDGLVDNKKNYKIRNTSISTAASSGIIPIWRSKRRGIIYRLQSSRTRQRVRRRTKLRARPCCERGITSWPEGWGLARIGIDQTRQDVHFFASGVMARL